MRRSRRSTKSNWPFRFTRFEMIKWIRAMTMAAHIAVQKPLTWKLNPIEADSLEVISSIVASMIMIVSPKVIRIRQTENAMKSGLISRYVNASIADPANKAPMPSISTLSNRASDAHSPTNSEQNLVMRLRPLYWLLALVPSRKRRICLLCGLIG